MKKKIEKLRRDGQLKENAAFEALWTAFKTAETELEKARTDRKLAKSTYQFERDARDVKAADETQLDKVFELEMAWRKADGERLIRRADFQLAKFRLRRWVEAFSRASKAEEPAAAIQAEKRTTQSKPKKERQKLPATPATQTASAAPRARKKTKTES